jgi:hypothetical protein
MPYMKLKNKLPNQLQKQLADSFFIGRLATSDEVHHTIFKDDAVTLFDQTDIVQFFIKSLSDIPEELKEYMEKPDGLLDGTTQSGKNKRIFNEKIDFERLPYPDIKPKTIELLDNKAILFQFDVVNNNLYVDIIAIEEVQPQEHYKIIPGPDLRLSESVDDLQRKMTSDPRPITLKNYPNIFPSPELLIYKNMIYQVKLESKSNPTTYFQNQSSVVKAAPLTLKTFNDLVSIRHEDHLFFTSDEQYNELLAIIETTGAILEGPSHHEPIMNDDHNHLLDNGDKYQPSLDSEITFIQHVIQKAKHEYKMFYYDEDIYSFHISVKTNPLTVLGGMSGTGKSQLARIYGEALGLVEDDSMLFIPISPAYQEPNDILGYLNPQTSTFHESDTGLVSLLLEAELNPEKLYMVIFDEMNLSQVEHWFSPFLSLLEKSGDKYLQVFNKNNVVTNLPYKPSIKLGENVIFVGTVNFDETSKAFSDRLLDRTNVITPKKAPFIKTVDYYQENRYENNNFTETTKISTDLFRKEWKSDTSNIGLHFLNENEIYVLDKLHQLINDIDPQKGVSFRVALSIVDFMHNVPVDHHNKPLIPRGKLFDYQVNQRILTKIKGIDTFARPLVGYIDGEQNYVDGQLAKLFKDEHAKLVSDFEVSLKTLKNKAKELMMYGFTN